MKIRIPTDPVFFVETVLGLIATARSIIMSDLRQDREPSDELLDILNIATHRIYANEFLHNQADFLVHFIRTQEKNLLIALGKAMISPI